ncbi:MAG: 2-C-methyl-D-erythritol 4-phosphate cytidylyltransferase [Phycisphaerae bacterium]|nr:2-C-methyl-D-erythritol 4-phosphate cytidylyltransferase [Phycisphaerae bacterium]
MSKVAVIIPAAGAGKRFGGDVKKPFAQLDGRPIFIRSIELFISRPDVCQVILAVAPDDYDVVREKYAANLMFMNIKLVRGGEERYASVQAALQAVVDEAELICVHDAVRPCVLDSWIDAVFAEAGKSGAAILASRLTGTIKRASDAGVIDQTVPRAGLWEAQTPQVFRRKILCEAYAALKPGSAPTDDAQVVELSGHPVAVVEADRRNLKITSPADMAVAGAVLKTMSRPARGPAPRGPFEEAQW